MQSDKATSLPSGDDKPTSGPWKPVFFDCKTDEDREKLVERFREHLLSGGDFFYGVQAEPEAQHEFYAEQGYDLSRGVTIAWTGNGPNSAANALFISDARNATQQSEDASELDRLHVLAEAGAEWHRHALDAICTPPDSTARKRLAESWDHFRAEARKLLVAKQAKDDDK